MSDEQEQRDCVTCRYNGPDINCAVKCDSDFSGWQPINPQPTAATVPAVLHSTEERILQVLCDLSATMPDMRILGVDLKSERVEGVLTIKEVQIPICAR